MGCRGWRMIGECRFRVQMPYVESANTLPAPFRACTPDPARPSIGDAVDGNGIAPAPLSALVSHPAVSVGPAEMLVRRFGSLCIHLSAVAETGSAVKPQATAQPV